MQLTDEMARLFANLGRALAKRPHQGMDHQDFSTLVTLSSGACSEGARLSDLAAMRGFDVSTMSRRVAHLCDSGLLERHPDPQDGRAHLLSLNDAGRHALSAERARRVHLITESLGEWTPEDKSELARLLSRLNDSLENA
ncbi:MarR family winged helix-turn-helix transcriptional regulator [Tessaracoccus antarcticus]|uniref:MarR family transcriptional regulator n=1 Tax=Tessaracoccus antarcticus TaxID=2479848 RepID=A0A3M0GA89_9ACTN|nr:MarR family winged helix-turn-helix transcriptional regulator [Tessaracoccus antarcticus]RMB61328.1 MarR family transcriptional regulator [Tessaracoccus antarcticus]